MTTARVQAALAYMLVSEAGRADLKARPEMLRKRFSLSQTEITALQTADRAHIQLTAEAVAGKRVLFLQRTVPATMALLERVGKLDPILCNFLQHRLPFSAEEGGSRLVAEGRRFVEYLMTPERPDCPEYVPSVAELELLRMQLSFSSEASASATRAREFTKMLQGRLAVDDEGETPVLLRLGSHVRLASFPYDVLSLVDEILQSEVVPTPSIRPTYLALRKPANSSAIAAYRLDSRTYSFLEQSLVGGVVADMTPKGRDGERWTVGAVLCVAIQNEFFLSSSGVSIPQ